MDYSSSSWRVHHYRQSKGNEDKRFILKEYVFQLVNLKLKDKIRI